MPNDSAFQFLCCRVYIPLCLQSPPAIPNSEILILGDITQNVVHLSLINSSSCPQSAFKSVTLKAIHYPTTQLLKSCKSFLLPPPLPAFTAIKFFQHQLIYKPRWVSHSPVFSRKCSPQNPVSQRKTCQVFTER
jgi:hypothetical protein